MVSLIGRSLGFSHLPLPDDGPSPSLLPVGEAADWVGGADHFTAPAKLQLLTHLHGTPVSRTSLEPIAVSLVRRDLGGRDVSQKMDELLDLVYATQPGDDPLSGATSGILPEDDLLSGLVADLQLTSARVSPTCEATTRIVRGYPALSLTTTITTTRPLTEVGTMADPRFWPQCHPQSAFFKSMDMVQPAAPPLPSLRGPDEGWSARLRETVDFSFGLNPSGSSRMKTDLDFVYFDTGSAVGCTYDLGRSIDRHILVDRGYVLVEDLGSRDVRRTTTLKQVHFRSRPQPGDVCQFWSLAHGMVSSSCMSKPHSVSGSPP